MAVLDAVLVVRSDLRLHGFGVKLTSLLDHRVRRRLFSADTGLSPLGWEHVNITGDYVWEDQPRLDDDGFRPLVMPS